MFKNHGPGGCCCGETFIETCGVYCPNCPGAGWTDRIAVDGDGVPADTLLLAPAFGTWSGAVTLPGFDGYSGACAPATVDLPIGLTVLCPATAGGPFRLTQAWRYCGVVQTQYVTSGGTFVTATVNSPDDCNPYGTYDFSATNAPLQSVTLSAATSAPIVAGITVTGCYPGGPQPQVGATVGITAAHSDFSDTAAADGLGYASFVVPRSDRYYFAVEQPRYDGKTVHLDAGCWRTLTISVRKCVAGVLSFAAGAEVEFDDMAETVGSGTVALPFFDAGTKSIRAHLTGLGDRTAPLTLGLAANVSTTLLLPDPIMFKVKAIGGVAGCGMPGATVRVFRDDIGYDQTEVADGTGHAEFTPPLGATYSVQASLPGLTTVPTSSAVTTALCATTTFNSGTMQPLAGNMLLPAMGARAIPASLNIAVAPGWNGGAAPAGTTVAAPYLNNTGGRYNWRYTSGGQSITASVGPHNACTAATYQVASTATGATETAGSGTAIPDVAFATTSFTVSEP